ncbi:DUF84 family protein [Halomarina litorea]|uniref:DUF84 family protein n=1 Tax=Halomarina litorea TaxID=2961595 RepID=UPI0020C2010E|nr:inosine/xanthosine triphosphatase [Halomarina sp. BCD28]
MHVGVGSRNPVKRRAVERVVPAGWSVTSIGVQSGVAEQPFGQAETLAGAEGRAETVLAASGPENDRDGESGFDLGVGIEGGVARREYAEGLWLVMWAAATDGERWGRGTGPGLRLPDGIAARVEAGEELGPVMDDVLGEADVAKKQGAAGALTGGATDRESALAGAVAGALGPFVTSLY